MNKQASNSVAFFKPSPLVSILLVVQSPSSHSVRKQYPSYPAARMHQFQKTF